MTPGNLLRHSVSPYLLQHKDNPVHWRPWGAEAIEEARRSGRPILLSVGYAACHWCHVMAHESFEDPGTAAVMNELFVNIKVDREERPDIDHLYMSALHALGQQGGWPLTMFLTPDAEPFWGGTYFPKDAKYGRPSFTQVLRQVSDVFHRDPGRVTHNAEALRAALAADAAGAQSPKEDLDLALVDALALQLARSIDRVNGGLSGAPKFPNPALLQLLWRSGTRARRPELTDLVILTLERMAQGGIYDHLGGGFARYSVDERWLVPHFEKMLYDNAQLLELLALAYRHTGREIFRTRAQETVDWIQREMRLPEGAFAASLDADSEGVEGKFYVWQAREIQDVLGVQDAAIFASVYDVSPHGNWHDEHSGETVTILNRLRAEPATPEDEDRLRDMRAKLLARRGRRIRPGLDDKILADWNGLMIAALVNSGTALDEPSWIIMAASAFAFIADHLGMDARLGHAWRAGQSVHPGFALDYAAMITAALALYEATREAAYLERARGWLASLRDHHRDAGTGLFAMSAEDAQDVPLRLAPTTDDAVPNAHGVVAAALYRLSVLSGTADYLVEADAVFAAVTSAARAHPFAHASLLNALDLRLTGVEIVIAGRHRDELREAALRVPFLNRVVVDLSERMEVRDDHPAKAQLEMAGGGAAFICTAGRCSLPVKSPDEIAARVEDVLGVSRETASARGGVA